MKADIKKKLLAIKKIMDDSMHIPKPMMDDANRVLKEMRKAGL